MKDEAVTVQGDIRKDVVVVEASVVDQDTGNDQNVVVFTKEYDFEGKRIGSVDLSGFDNLTSKDLIEANKVLERSGSISFMPEMTLEYACVIASKATDLPQEFFYSLKPKDATRLKNRIVGFFFGAE